MEEQVFFKFYQLDLTTEKNLLILTLYVFRYNYLQRLIFIQRFCHIALLLNMMHQEKCWVYFCLGFFGGQELCILNSLKVCIVNASDFISLAHLR